MDTATETKTVAGESPQDIKGKIVEFSFWMLKQGYSKSTIQSRTKLMKRLVRLEADVSILNQSRKQLPDKSGAQEENAMP